MPYHVQFPGFGWEFDINPIAFSIGDYKVYWYGIIIACGLLLAVLYAWKSAPRYKVDGSKLVNCVFAGMITGIIGARLYFCFFKWDYYGQNPIEILYINNGGLAIYGGIIGALLGGLTVAKIQKMEINIQRINELARKAKAEGLTPAEKEEQQKLRREYIAAVKMNLRTQLDNIDVQEKDGTIVNLGERYGSKRKH